MGRPPEPHQLFLGRNEAKVMQVDQGLPPGMPILNKLETSEKREDDEHLGVMENAPHIQ